MIFVLQFADKWIFDSNFEVVFPLSQDWLNYKYPDNNTDKIKFVVVLHAIRAVLDMHLIFMWFNLLPVEKEWVSNMGPSNRVRVIVA